MAEQGVPYRVCLSIWCISHILICQCVFEVCFCSWCISHILICQWSMFVLLWSSHSPHQSRYMHPALPMAGLLVHGHSPHQSRVLRFELLMCFCRNRIEVDGKIYPKYVRWVIVGTTHAIAEFDTNDNLCSVECEFGPPFETHQVHFFSFAVWMVTLVFNDSCLLAMHAGEARIRCGVECASQCTQEQGEGQGQSHPGALVFCICLLLLPVNLLTINHADAQQQASAQAAQHWQTLHGKFFC